MTAGQSLRRSPPHGGRRFSSRGVRSGFAGGVARVQLCFVEVAALVDVVRLGKSAVLYPPVNRTVANTVTLANLPCRQQSLCHCSTPCACAPVIRDNTRI